MDGQADGVGTDRSVEGVRIGYGIGIDRQASGVRTDRLAGKVGTGYGIDIDRRTRRAGKAVVLVRTELNQAG